MKSVKINVKGRWFFKKGTSKVPFGMTMPGRSYNAHTSRHGFTGHEKESDLAEGIYTTEYRLYDARVGRWLSIDPLFEKYVGMSPYNYCAGNPVKLVDVDGRDAEVIGTGTEEDPYIVTAKYYYTKNGEYKISDDAINGLKSAVAQYNNKGKTWECGPRKNKIYVKFDLQLEEVEDKPNYKVSKHQFTSNGELFLSGNFVSTETTKYDDGTYAMGSASFNSINIKESRIYEEAKKNGFTKSELFESTFVHEIGHNLGLLENVGDITIAPSIREDKDFGIIKTLPKVSKSGVFKIIEGLNCRTHEQCENDKVGVIRSK